MLFDWANSPYPTVILTFVFSAYFTKLVAEDEISGTFLWSQTIAFSGLFMAFVAPILGAISDETGKKKIWILVFSILAILATLEPMVCIARQKIYPSSTYSYRNQPYCFRILYNLLQRYPHSGCQLQFNRESERTRLVHGLHRRDNMPSYLSFWPC